MTPFYLRMQRNLQAGVAALAIATTFLLVSQTLAQDEVPGDDRSGRDKVLRMVKTDTPPVIDGIMDDVWYTAAVVEDFHQVHPIEYSEPSEKTIVYVLYGESAIYIGARMIYENPEDIIAKIMIQGGDLRYDDKFRLYINPFNDGRNGYLFETNAHGIRVEAIFENVRDLNRDWTGLQLKPNLSTAFDGW